MLSGRAPALSIREIAAPAALFLLVLAWIIVQTLPLKIAAQIPELGDGTPATLSVDPGATAIATTRLLTAVCVFWLATQLGRNGEICLNLLRTIAAIAAFYSACGLFLAAAYDNAIPGFAAPDGGGEVRSTFVNRNTFAAFAGLGLVTILALGARDGGARWRAPRMARRLENLGRRGPLVAAGLVVSAALLGSASRGGALSCAVGVGLLFGLLAERRRRRGQGRTALLVAVAALLLAFVALGGPIAARIAEIGLSDVQRLGAYRTTLDAVLSRPLIGFGYGAFAEVFPLFRGASLSPVGVWEMAHNSYLELALDLGIVFAAALILALALLGRRCLQGALRRNRHETAPLAAVSALTLIGVDALIDYSVQIEAVTLTLMALLGLGVAQSRGAAAC